MRAVVACSLALALLAADRGAAAQDAPPGSSPEREHARYIVQQGDTCESIAARLYGDGRYYFIVLDALGSATGVLRTSCDRALRPGQALVLPTRIPPDRRASDARLTAVIRDVRSRPPGSSWRAAHQGEDLFRAWRINTLEKSGAEITFRNESVIQVREETLVIIFGPSADTARRSSSRAVLEHGALRSRLAELRGHGDRLRVETPSATADLNEGEAVVSLDRDRTSHVANHSGRPARVRGVDGLGEVLVGAGMGTSIKQGARPERPRPLLPPPRWAENAIIEVRIHAGEHATVAGSWHAVDGAAGYRVEASRTADRSEPVATTEGPGHVTSFELRALSPGTYFLTVAAIDDRGLEGPPSEAREVRIVAPEPTTSISGAGPSTTGVESSTGTPAGRGPEFVRPVPTRQARSHAIRPDLTSTWHLPETWGLVATPAVTGVRDERRGGNGIWLAIDTLDAGTDHTASATLGVRLSFIGERLRLELGVPLTAGRGLVASLGSLVVEQSRWGLAAELRAWLPTRELDGELGARLAPVVDASFRPHPRVAVRTRQALDVEVVEDGALLWDSGYALDYRITNVFSVGIDAVLLLGRQGHEVLAAPALGATLTLDRPLWTLAVSFRGGIGDDAEDALGRLSIAATLRVSDRE